MLYHRTGWLSVVIVIVFSRCTLYCGKTESFLFWSEPNDSDGPLGMESRQILDSQLTSSNSHSWSTAYAAFKYYKRYNRPEGSRMRFEAEDQIRYMWLPADSVAVGKAWIQVLCVYKCMCVMILFCVRVCAFMCVCVCVCMFSHFCTFLQTTL